MKIGNAVRRLSAAAGLSVLSALGSAAEVVYEEARFNAALAQRGGFVVALVTDWCTTCSRQELIVAALLEEPRFRDLTVFIADFDREFDLRQRLRVVTQGTFVVFKDGKEVARSTGQTQKKAIEDLFAKAF
ncbi:MAG: thioredoxin family protein [Burkholderiales bacterium]|nr:MAG: thioredoxin family protein [Burkholderiales bacterium]